MQLKHRRELAFPQIAGSWPSPKMHGAAPVVGELLDPAVLKQRDVRAQQQAGIERHQTDMT